MCVTDLDPDLGITENDLDIRENEQVPGVAWGRAGKYAGVAWGQLGTEAQNAENAENAEEAEETAASR
jgi:hypothetical protein